MHFFLQSKPAHKNGASPLHCKPVFSVFSSVSGLKVEYRYRSSCLYIFVFFNKCVCTTCAAQFCASWMLFTEFRIPALVIFIILWLNASPHSEDAERRQSRFFFFFFRVKNKFKIVKNHFSFFCYSLVLWEDAACFLVVGIWGLKTSSKLSKITLVFLLLSRVMMRCRMFFSCGYFKA